jgi:hypothetical protein
MWPGRSFDTHGLAALMARATSVVMIIAQKLRE